MSDLTAPAPNFDQTGRYTDIANTITPGLTEGVKPYEQKLTDLGGNIDQGTNNIVKTITDQIGNTQNVYKALADELKRKYGQDVQRKVTEKTGAIGTQRANAAIQGFDTTSGFEADQARNTEKSYDQQIGDITDAAVSQDRQNTAQMHKEITDLIKETEAAKLQGDTTLIGLNSKLIDSKIQQTQIIQQATQAIQNAETEKEKQYYTNLYNDAMISIQKEQNDIERQKLELSKTSEANSNAARITGLNIEQQNANTDKTYKEGQLAIEKQKANQGNKAAVYEDNEITRAAGLVGQPISQSGNQKIALYQAKADAAKARAVPAGIPAGSIKGTYDPNTGKWGTSSGNVISDFINGILGRN